MSEKNIAKTYDPKQVEDRYMRSGWRKAIFMLK